MRINSGGGGAHPAGCRERTSLTAPPAVQGKIVISGAPEGLDARLIAELAAGSDSPILHIARDDRRMATMRDALDFFAPKCDIRSFPAWDCPPYSRVSPNAGITSRRVATLTRLVEEEPAGRRIVLTTLNAAMQRTPGRTYLAGTSLTGKTGGRLSMESVMKFLESAGYARSPSVHGPGEYAVRGGILDVYPAGSRQPVRLDFFGDQLDGIRLFDPETQMTVGRETSVRIGHDAEFSLDSGSISNFRRRFRAEFGADRSGDRIYRAVSEGLNIPGIEHWLPFFHESLETVFEYLPSSVVCIDDGIEELCGQRWDSLASLYAERSGPGRAGGREIPPPVLDPALLHMNPDEFLGKLNRRPVRLLTGRKRSAGPDTADAGGRTGREFAAERARKDVPLIECVAGHLKELRSSRSVMVACWSDGSRKRFASMLGDVGVATAEISDVSELGRFPGVIDLAVAGLERGYVAEDLAVVSEQDVFGERLVRKSRKRRSSAQLLAETGGFSPGDLVVHEENGIGRYLGLETVMAANAPYDCAVLEYAGGARLYLPVINIDLLSKYGSGDAVLDRLGAAGWQERKARMKKRLLDIADELISTAAERSTKSAPVLVPDRLSWDSFLARFQYQETEDQAQAVDDVLADFRGGMPMDRLICGDVGFGKTEVAMRAAFVTAMSGMQVAVIAPTTLLVRQHFETFRDRFAGFPVVVRQLSRTVSRQDADGVRQSLAAGACDIVIGTHALLGESVKFKQLGLAIVDEEQSFGVSHKEKFKELRSAVHVLSLTATPIPRTLQMALSGVRDLSIIATPPADRLSIRTYVLEFDPVTVRSALLHELHRGGQSFIVVPRIKDLPEFAAFLEENVPEVSFVTAHGQLPKADMEKRTAEFYDGKCDVLLSTTIVASGLDIPAANTIIIVRAERFGLAQLYQIRGRVGRSGVRAYAYITYNTKSKLTEAAQRRFEILSGLDALGAGFSLAAQDLDLRGGGNLLGSAQTGHIREVGVELYQKMLAEAVSEMKSDGQPAETESGRLVPQINLRVSARIPDSYVSNLSVRLGLYRRIGTLTAFDEIDGFAAELIDRFGILPREVETLLQIVRIKLLCRQAGISRLDAGPKGGTVEFQGNSFANVSGLVEFISSQEGSATVRGGKLMLRREWRREEARLRGSARLAREIAGIAAVPSRP